MDYLDFVLRLDLTDGGGLIVRLVRSPAGETNEPFVLPAVRQEVERTAQSFERLVESEDEVAFRDLASPSNAMAKSQEWIGTQLFEALFPRSVHGLYQWCMGQLDLQQNVGLRIKLEMDLGDPRLLAVHDLPWELLYQADVGRFLGRGRRVSIARYLVLPLPGSRPPLVDPLRVLVVTAQPRGSRLQPLPHLERERRALVELNGRQNRLEVVSLARPTLAALHEALLSGGFHVLHFLGHGEFEAKTGEGFLYLEDAEGGAARVSGTVLANHLPSLYMVVLNACQTARSASPSPFGGVAAALLRTGISAVVAMQFPISDRAASAFGAELYKSLAAGDSIDAAVGEGRLRILRDFPASAEWATPVLFSRASAIPRLAADTPSSPESRLFLPSVGLPPAEDLDVYRLLHWESGLAEQLVGRDSQRAELLEWAQTALDPERPRFRFLIGPGGSGKTRLAFEVARILRGMGWTAGFAPPGFVDIPPIRTKGLFVVVDYPEERREETVRLLSKLSIFSNLPAPVRILLLSRQESVDWDLELSKSRARRFFTRQNVEMGSLNAGEARQLFEDAYHRLASHLNVRPSGSALTEFGTWVQGEPELHALPLFILAAVVHVVLMKRPLSSLSAREVLEALVERELDRMRNTAEGLGLDPFVAERLSALSALSGNLDDATLRRLAEPSVELSLPAPHEVMHKIWRSPWWEKGCWISPKPDVLAAVHTWMTLGRDYQNRLAVSEWIWTTLYGAMPPNRTEVRAPSWARQVDRVLYDILRVEGARAYREARNWFTDMVSGRDARAGALEPLLSIVPVPSALTALAISVADVLRAQRPAGSPAAAQLANRVSLQLAQEGRFEDAVTVATDAVLLYEELASAEPVRYEADLTSARHNLSIWLPHIERTQDALTAGEQAVAGYRRLSNRDPQRYTASLALALNNLSNRLAEVGREDDALTVVQEAVYVLRELSRHDAETHEPELARALTTLSSHLRAKGRYDEALLVAQEAIDIRRRLAQRDPARYDTALAITLNNAANLLGDLQRPQEALSLLREVITIHERLATALPMRYESDLAHNLNNLAVHLLAVGQRREAIETIERAVGIYRHLAMNAPEEGHELSLARSLNNLSAQQRAFGDSHAALSSIEEAVPIYHRRLAARTPAAHESELATVLDAQQTLLGDLGRHEEAVTVGVEAEAILERLAAESPKRYAAAHARTLSNLSLVLAATAQAARALAATDKAVAIVRRLATEHPELYESELAQGLNNKLLRLLDGGRIDEAVSAGREAVEIRRTQSARLPDRFKPDLARALSNLSLALARNGLPLDAVGAAEEASDIYRRLHRKEPCAWARRFANTLSVLGKHHLGAGMAEAAAATFGEGVLLARSLKKESPRAHGEMFKVMLQRYSEALTRVGDDVQRAAIEAELASLTEGDEESPDELGEEPPKKPAQRAGRAQPRADALGKQAQSPRGLKGRETLG
ncbi:MAG TPA: CHAT domain-containing protein [Thermoanaerobaculia bacterium]|jgi:hypothetical protein|nr:CHAT domain-containing protein [Thermoanaerobaculia bacterium]